MISWFLPFFVATPYKGEAVFRLVQPGLGIKKKILKCLVFLLSQSLDSTHIKRRNQKSLLESSMIRFDEVRPKTSTKNKKHRQFLTNFFKLTSKKQKLEEFSGYFFVQIYFLNKN